MKNESPYIITYKVVETRKYNPNYGDDRECICGHPYYRHFDTYDNMNSCGCKYCECFDFVEKVEGNKVFLVRSHDFAIWEEDLEKPGCYRTMETPDKEMKNRQNAYDHWTFENLTKSYDFFPISESQVPEYLEKHNFHIGFIGWQCRNDGHGGAKGGTKEEYKIYLERVKRSNEK